MLEEKCLDIENKVLQSLQGDSTTISIHVLSSILCGLPHGEDSLEHTEGEAEQPETVVHIVTNDIGKRMRSGRVNVVN